MHKVFGWLMFLRIVSCYAIVSIHFGRTLPCADLAVPIFMIMAFWFSAMAKRDYVASSKSLFRRLVRIAIPYFFWGCIGCVARWGMERVVDWRILILQLLFGQSGNSPLWFLCVLMICTIIVGVIVILPDYSRWIVVGAIFIVCFGLQYTGINSTMWRWLPSAGEVTMGRIAEMMPYAIVGLGGRFFFGNEGRRLLYAGIVSLCVAVCFLNSTYSASGYNYCGGMRFLLASGFVFICAGLDGLVPFKQCVLRPIATVGGLTAGCYYMHKLVGEAIRRIISSQSTIGFTLMVFVCCMLLVYCFKRNKFMLRIIQ